MVVFLSVIRYNGEEDREIQQVKLPSSNFFAKRGEKIHTKRSLAANYSSLHVEKKRFKVTKDDFEVDAELATSKEEADTRTLLHTKQDSSNYIYMVIVTIDKYVLSFVFLYSIK